ncbi:TPA: hypothetical protein O7X39_004509 [Salmonella enterica]|nr:hypothetical protein [Salmonella enterica]
MLIISLMNKIFIFFVVILLLLPELSCSGVAHSRYTLLTDRGYIYILDSSNDNTKISVPLSGNVAEQFIVDNLNDIGRATYLAVFQKQSSNPEQPAGFCGSGSELWLHIYKIYGRKVTLFGSVLAGSCKKSFSMASLESGYSGSDRDYSSFKWNASGFSIEWFSKKDAYGNFISKTFYTINNDGICIEKNYTD